MSELEKSKLKKLGRTIKRTRREIGMTQARLAELIGVEVSHIWRLEKGMSNMSLLTYWRLCEVLFIS